MPHKYTKIASGRLFKNATEDENGNPRRGPSLSNSKVEIMEDLKAGDTVELAGWVNKNDDGEQTLTITVTRKELIDPGANTLWISSSTGLPIQRSDRRWNSIAGHPLR